MSWTRTVPGQVAPDVAILNGEVHLVSGPSPWTWQTFGLDGTPHHTRTQTLGYYPKTNGHVSVAHDGVRYLYWPLDGEPAVNPAAAPWGNNPTGLSPMGVRAWQAYPDVVVVAGEDVRHDALAARPTGIWEVHDDGTYVRMDEANRSEPWAGGYVYHAPGGRLVVAEASDGGIVGELDGVRWHLAPGTDTKWPRAVLEGDLVAICSWGDPGPATRLWVGTTAELLAYAVPSPVLPEVPADLAGRDLWLGYFFAVSDRYGDNLTAPGNCTILHTETEAARSPWPYYAPPGVAQGPRKIGSWVSVPRGQSWPEPALSTDVLLYDGGSQLPETPSGAITALECYADPDEPVIAVDARLREWLRRWPAAPVILIGQAYSRNGAETDDQKLADLQGLPLDLAVDFPQVRGILYFSDGRPTGTRDHEWWRPVHAEAAGLVRTPQTGGDVPTWDLEALLQAFAAAFPVPQQLPDESLEALEARCREWTVRFCEQAAFSARTGGYGAKRAAPDRPISKDALAAQRGGSLWAWDLLIGVATGHPVLVSHPSAQDITGQVFVPVAPVNHLGQPDDKTLEERVSYLEAVLPIYGARIRGIEAALRTCGASMPE